jgi:hypothetical protein
MANPTDPFVYRSLDDIRARKKALRAELNRDGKQMRTHWNGLFVKPDDKQLPARRLTQFVSTGVTLFDGLLFAYKLYNRLSGGKRQINTKKRSKRSSLLSLFFR